MKKENLIIWQRIVRKYIYLNNIAYTKKRTKLLKDEVDSITSDENIIYLFANPTHENLGDHAQTMCILQWFSSSYPKYRVVCVPSAYQTPYVMDTIQSKIKPTDKIFIHSGYIIYDSHPELNFVCEVVSRFKTNKIVILPQTVNLLAAEKQKLVSNVFNYHPNLLLMCRDEVSLSRSKELFSCNMLLYPDFVTSLIGILEKPSNIHRKGILFILRNDGEKYYSEEQLIGLMNRFKGYKIRKIDTSITATMKQWMESRYKLITKYIKQIAGYQLVITDRYHGTIFSQIMGTPTIVLSSADHKLSSGVKWFSPKAFDDYIYYANNLNEAYSIAKQILEKKDLDYKLLPYFKQHYWDALSAKIDEVWTK